MEFRTYLDRDGYLKGRTVVLHGPIQPGTLLTKVPTIADMELRFGVIIAVHGTQVDVLWNPWRPLPKDSIKEGELRRLMGCPVLTTEDYRRIKQEKYDARRRQRQEKEEEASRDPARAGDPGA